MIKPEIALVLEGGGLRGVFICGVLKPIEVSRMEKDTAKLTALYNEGYELAMNIINV